MRTPKTKNAKRGAAAWIAAMALLVAPKVASATHCDADYATDIGLVPTPYLQTYDGDCTGEIGCDDYFDVTMLAGQTLFLSTCPADGGSASFDTGLSVWTGPGFGSLDTCIDDSCGLQTQLTLVAPAAGTYRVRVGGFGGSMGTYRLVYQATSVCDLATPTWGCRVNGRLGPCVGTSGSDVIIGTSRRDRIDGRGGDDYIVGLEKKDLLCGGGGDDVLIGGPGADSLVGESGDDILEGLGGRDVLDGGPGNDKLDGGGGNDTCQDPDSATHTFLFQSCEN